MNPCPCGYFSDPQRECTCTPSMVSRYKKRIPGPLLDRIGTLSDIEVPRVEYEKLSDDRLGEPSAAIRECPGLSSHAKREADLDGSDQIEIAHLIGPKPEPLRDTHRCDRVYALNVEARDANQCRHRR